jgi:hypothetical protein
MIARAIFDNFTLLSRLSPLLCSAQEIAVFQEHTLRVMTDLAQSLLSFSLDYTPQLLDEYMGLFCDACRVHILAAKMPRPLVLQVRIPCLLVT